MNSRQFVIRFTTSLSLSELRVLMKYSFHDNNKDEVCIPLTT